MHRQSSQCHDCYSCSGEQIKINCPVCGEVFVRYASTGGKYCSRSCARSGSPTRKKTSLEVNCLVCHKPFRKHLSEIRKNVGGLHFCSSECWYEYNQLENHYGWNGGQHERMNPQYRIWRKLVLERDFKLCRRCHFTENLEAHHIYRFNDRPELRWEVGNGITLCKKCHRMVTGREIYWEDNFFDMISLGL